MRGHLPPELPYHWSPDAARPLWRDRLLPGMLLPFRHQVWRVIEVKDYPSDLQDAYDPKYHLILRPAHRGDDPRDRDYDVSLSVRQYYTWCTYEDEHYPVCAVCREPTPCRDTMARRTAAEAAERSAKVAARAEIGCMACGEPVTTRQKTIVFEGLNLDAPTAASPVFHLRARCFDTACRYELRWVKAEPGRRLRLQCPGENRRHVDGWQCTEGDACPGADAYHTNRVWCPHQETRCLHCADARARGDVLRDTPTRRRRKPQPVAPGGFVVPAAKLGAVVHITDANRPEHPKPVKLPGRTVVAQFPPGAVLGHTLCDTEMLAEDAWVGYRGDPVADGSLCGDCGKRAGVTVDQREAS